MNWKAYSAVAAGVILGCVVSSYVYGAREDALRSSLRSSALRADSLEAIADSTRLVLTDSEKLVDIWQRRAIQSEDELWLRDRELETETATVAELELGTDTIYDTTFVMVDSAKVTRASLRHKLLHVDVELAGDSAFWEWAIPNIPLTVSVGCFDARDQRGGVARGAEVSVEAPQPLGIQITSGRADPDVCNPRVDSRPWWDRFIIGAAIAVASTVLLSR